MKRTILMIMAIALFLAVNAFAGNSNMPVKSSPITQPIGGGEQLFDSGGPDAFGYVWKDSDEPDGPTYNWVDITQRGTRIVGIPDDSTVGPYSMGFPFSLYGESSTNIWVCANGFISTEVIDMGGQTYPFFSNYPLPTAAQAGIVPGQAICPMWDDFSPPIQGDVYYWAGTDSFIVSWINTTRYSTGGNYTFQVILTGDDKITYQYQTLSGELDSCTVGIQNRTGTIGLQVVYNSSYLRNNFAVQIEVPSEEEIVYSEDFEDGMGAWQGEWGLSTVEAHSAPYSMADSPTGNYADYDTVIVTMNSDIDLSAYAGASLEFWTKYDIEEGFDYVYLDVSADGGQNWLNLDVFNGEGVPWTLYEKDLGGFAGQSIRFRFTLESDAGYNADGMYVDDIVVYGSTEDVSPPLIVTDGATDSTFAPDDFVTMATITDYTGVASATLSYSVDGGNYITVSYDSTSGDDYYFTVPAQEAGAMVKYYITAEDDLGHSGSTREYLYMAGYMVYYDDGEAEYIYQYAAGNSCATRMTVDDNATLVTAMLRLYTDVNRPLDTVDVYIWNTSGSNPGSTIFGPMAVYPWSTLPNPEAWTYVDLRGESIPIDNNFYVGYTLRSEWPVILGDSPEATGRSKTYLSGAWAAAGTDFHIRCVVDYPQISVDDGETTVPVEYALQQNYPNPFNAQTKINYSLVDPTDVKLEVFNVAGQKVATLVNGHESAGSHSVTWDASDVSSGVYFYKLTAGEKTFTRKMSLLK